ncbi:MAG: DUF6517 family protein [Haloferacaceae archaeon]
MNLRRVSLLLAVTLLVAGCAGSGGGDESSSPLVADAAPATLDEATLSATGYAHVSTTREGLNTTVSAAIQGDVTLSTTRQVNATTVTAVYRRATDAAPVVVTLTSVPAVRPFERADLVKNPAAGRSVAAFVAGYDVTGVEEAGRRQVTLLGNETTLTAYTAAGSTDGRSLRLVRATVLHEGDYVTLAVAAPSGATLRLARLLDGVAHEKTAS